MLSFTHAFAPMSMTQVISHSSIETQSTGYDGLLGFIDYDVSSASIIAELFFSKHSVRLLSLNPCWFFITPVTEISILKFHRYEVYWKWRVTSLDKTRRRFKIAFELLNIRTIKISKLYKKIIFHCTGSDILCGISIMPFEIQHKIPYLYIERCISYPQVQIKELIDIIKWHDTINWPRSKRTTHYSPAPIYHDITYGTAMTATESK